MRGSNWKVAYSLLFALLVVGIASCRKTEPQSSQKAKPNAGVDLAHLDAALHIPSNYVVVQKPWRERPGYTVLLATPPSSEVVGTAILAVFKDGALIAQATDKNENCDLADDDLYQPAKDGTACTVKLDLAPYKIADNEFALGTRWHQDETFPAGEDNSEQLHLSRISSDHVSQILDTRMSGVDEQRGPNDLFQDDCTLAVSASKTLGYFDLIRRCTDTKGAVLEDDDPAKNKTQTRHTATLFKWDGAKYVEQKTGANAK